MCSIAGFLATRPLSIEDVERLRRRLARMIIDGADRGRDSCGIITIDRDGIVKSAKWNKPAYQVINRYELANLITVNTRIVVNTNRAEPTSEWIVDKSDDDIPPFQHGRYVIAHNGTIANDRELAEAYGVVPKSKVDSAVIPAIFNEVAPHGFLHPGWVKQFLTNDVIGSFALAIADADHPDRIMLATNYKPLYITYQQEIGGILFTSLETYLARSSLSYQLFNPSVVRVPPYTMVEIVRTKTGRPDINTYSLRKDPPKRKRTLVVHSGGLDSTVAATLAKNRGDDVTLLHFRYRCRAERKEVEAVQKIAAALGCGTMFIDTELFKTVIGHSKLTDTQEQLVVERGGEASAEYAHEWVPARNLIMLAIATGIAEAHGYDTIMLGANLEEAGAYPDNEMEFILRLNDVLPYATNLHKYVNIEMPVGNLMKHEIVKLGLSINAPLHLTWSCYEGGDRHCGTCGPCYMRKKAFEMNGLHDPVMV